VRRTFGPPAGDADTDMDSNPDSPDSPAQGQSKRRRVEWLEVESTVILGTEARDFVLQLAEYCKALDVGQAVQDFVTINHFSAGNGTLLSLTTAHDLHNRNADVNKFWRSLIEIQIALRCERFGSYWTEWHRHTDLIVMHSIGRSPGNVWDLKLSGLGEKGMSRWKFVELHGLGKKMCCMIAGGIFIYLLTLSVT